MKKMFTILLCCMLTTVIVFAFVGCGNKGLPDFADCEIGYQLEVYPKVAFDYKISEDCIVHIESITATLTAKNEIKAGDVLDKSFLKYEVTGKLRGSVDASFAGKIITLNLRFGLVPGGMGAIVQPDGTFEKEGVLSECSQNVEIYFVSVRLY